MKNLIIIFVLLIFGIEMSAQDYIINLRMNPNVSPYMDEWTSGDINAELQIINNNVEEIEVTIETELYFNEALVASNNTGADGSSVLLETGINIIETEDFLGNLRFDDMMISEKESIYFNRTKRLPPGNYEICIQLINAQTQELLPEVIPNNPACFPAIIMSYFPPTLLSPEDYTVVRSAETSTTTFQWTPVVPFYSEEVFYEIKVYEWFPDQTKEQAALVNVPVWETKTTETQAIFDFECLPWDETQAYVWQVQAVDGEGVFVGENSGYSGVCAFCGDGGVNSMGLIDNEGLINMPINFIRCICSPHDKATGTLGGKGTDFGVMSWGKGGGNMLARGELLSCPFFQETDSVVVNYSYYFVAECDNITGECGSIEAIDIQTLLYKNCDLVDPSGTNVSMSISYEINGVFYTGDIISVNSTMYNKESDNVFFEDYASRGNEIKISSDSCVARVNIKMVIYDAGMSSNDVYYLATSMYNHSPVSTVFPIMVDYTGGVPSLGILKNIRSEIDNIRRGEGDHINISAIPINGTKGCAIFKGKEEELNCRTPIEVNDDFIIEPR